MADTFRCGYIAIVGRPNAGKSTLLNRLVGEKLAITSPKPQTTRHRLLGVLHLAGAQLLFVDTPGVLEPKEPLNATLVQAAFSTLANADIVLTNGSRPLLAMPAAMPVLDTVRPSLTEWAMATTSIHSPEGMRP